MSQTGMMLACKMLYEHFSSSGAIGQINERKQLHGGLCGMAENPQNSATIE